MKKRLIIIIPIVVVIAGVFGWRHFRNNQADLNRLQVSGNIDVTQVDMAFKIPGRLALRAVEEGDRVTRGMLLARLDATDQALQVQKAAAEAAYARSVLAELESGSREQEIAGAEAELERAEAVREAVVSRLRLAEADFNRYQAVFEEGGVSRQAFESYKTRLDTTRNERNEAAAQVSAARQRLSLVREGPRRETLAQARARVEAAEAALALYRQQKAETEIFAPFDGVVLSTSAEPAAYLTPGMPVLTVAQIGRVWLRGFISETDLGRIRLGQPARVSTDAFPGKAYPGRISYISSSAEFTPKTVQTFEERVNLMYRIKIDLANPDGELKPGMPADAVIEVAQ
jgi:HlyD family secretion protein